NNAAAQDHLDENSAERKEIEDAIMAYYADKAAQAEASRIASEARVALEESRLAAESKMNTSSENTTSQDETYGTTTSREPEVSSSYVSFITPSRPVSSRAEVSSNRISSVYVEPSSQEPEPSSQEPEPSYSEIIDDPQPSAGYMWPVPGHYTLSSQWNEDRDSYNHGAIDISDGGIMNQAVVAAQSGTVILSNSDCVHNYGKGDDGNCGCGGGYGNYMMIDHGDGKATLYAHLTSLTVSSGSYVQQGQVIGYVGTTGWSSGPHLHFETRLNGVKYNPMTEYPNY
ncbi:MAG: M23 family metallopeptidase, partial [Lachnospiraceae bacterium]|nr:M23 family metallopeptidase [Lachnospiraceae bacterium]